MKFLKKIFENVLANIIAAGIIPVIVFLWQSNFFTSISGTTIKDAAILFIGLISLVFFIRLLFYKNKKRVKEKPEKISLAKINQMEYSGKLPILHESSTSFFSQRLAKAFPGQREIKWYNSIDSIKRLEILLQQPLVFGVAGEPNHWTEPVWWFRGGNSSSIKYFERLSKTKFLMDFTEIEVKRMAVVIDDSYYKSYIYIEGKGEKTLTKRDQISIDQQLEYRGYANEEYGLYKKTVISREEYDDGAAVIKGKIIDTVGEQQLRMRYLTDYNFIITAQEAPYNSKKYDRESKPFFFAILKGEKLPQDLFDLMASYNRNEM